MSAAVLHRADPDEQEKLGGAFVRSLVVHLLIVGGTAISGIVFNRGPVNPFGSGQAGAGAMVVTPVQALPGFYRDAPVNRVANDTSSQTPQRVTPRPVEPEPEPEDAIAIGKRDQTKKKKTQQKKFDLAQYRSQREQELKENQLTTKAGAAASSPLFTQTGSGGVGTGTGNPFGTRFGFYEQLIRECVSRKWNTQGVDPRLKTAPPVVVNFEILRNGAVRDVRIAQPSGNLALDISGQRAVMDCSPFPALPSGFERNSANIEFWFQLKR